MLSRKQIDDFWRDGYLAAENAVAGEQLQRLRDDICEWVEESRAHDAPFGEPTVDGRPVSTWVRITVKPTSETTAS